ncbi:MAG: glycosyltransferase family 1 protein [Gammaproteobacteria bacterium]
MRIAIVTDAWHPQVNGVVRTLETTGRYLERAGFRVCFVTPADFRTVPCPTYPEIRLALWPRRGVAARLREFDPDAVHIATEGPLGHAARAWCLAAGRHFTTSFHTQFPEYVRLRVPLPLGLSYAWLRRFHAAAARTLVPTASQRERLLGRGFDNLHVWQRGVDTSVFHPGDAVDYAGLARPLHLYMGRVAVEKNIEAFLALDLPGSQLVIGAGPDLERLRAAWPRAHFLGAKFGRELARHVAGADVFVFPSRTDTFGLVLLEALACGVPVAAFPVTGPVDVITDPRVGALDEDLGRAVARARGLARADCVAFAQGYAWEQATAVFASHLAFRERALSAG